MTTRESLASARPFADSRPGLNTSSPVSATKHTQATSRRPSAARYPTIAVRVPAERKSMTSSESSAMRLLDLQRDDVVVADLIDQDTQQVLGGAKGVIDRGEPGRVVAARMLRGHPDAA